MGPKANALFRQVTDHRSIPKLLPRSIAFSNSTLNPTEPIRNPRSSPRLFGTFIMKNLVRVIRWIGELLVILTAIIAIAWAFGAVWFDAPFGNANKFVAGLLAVASVATLVFVRQCWRKIGAVALLFGGVIIWWLTLSLSNDSVLQAVVDQKTRDDHQCDEVPL